MARVLILGLGLLTLLGCKPVGQGISNTGEFLSEQAENPSNERPE